MKKGLLLNGEISEVISKMGHTDMLAIGDCGLPIPDKTKRIDLALCKGVPTFIDTLKVILSEFEVEEVILADEIKDVSMEMYEKIKMILKDVKITFVSHEDLKYRLKVCKAVVRTGEQTPYCNIILKSGVVF